MEPNVGKLAIELLEKQGWALLSPEQTEQKRQDISNLILRNHLKTTAVLPTRPPIM